MASQLTILKSSRRCSRGSWIATLHCVSLAMTPFFVRAVHFLKSFKYIFFCFLFISFPAHAFPAIQEVVSDKGIKAWLIEDHKLPLVAMDFSFKGGVEMDAEDKQGLAVLTTNLLTQGAGSYDARAFQNRLAAKSIALSFNAGRDYIVGSLKTLTKNKDEAFSLLALTLQKPRFDKEDFSRLLEQQKIGVKFQVIDPSWQARYALYSYLYEGHPYGYRSQGQLSTLRNLTSQDSKELIRKAFTKDKLLVTVAGDISAKNLATALDKIFGALPESAVDKDIDDITWPASQTICVSRQGAQTDLFFAAPMVDQKNSDWYAAQLANYILGGGGFESRLMQAVRAQNGMTYGISTGLASMDKDSLIMGSFSVANDQTAEAIYLLKSVWKHFYQKGITSTELQKAKDYLIGSWPLYMTSRSSVSGTLLALRQEAWGTDYLQKRKEFFERVTVDDMNRVIRNYFDPSSLNIAAVGAVETLSCDQTRPLAGE